MVFGLGAVIAWLNLASENSRFKLAGEIDQKNYPKKFVDKIRGKISQ
jgi:hypothetical protein